MKTMILTIAIFLLTLSACNNGSTKSAKVQYGKANGHYLIQPYMLEGNCVAPREFEIIIWQAEVFDNPHNSNLIIEGQLIDGVRINAVATDRRGVMISIAANLDDFEFITGEWEVIIAEDDSETEGDTEEPIECRGYVSGQRI